MLIADFLRHLDRVIPLKSTGYERDAVGLQVGLDNAAELTHVLFAYEVTNAVAEEAIRRRCNLIVAFHPLIFPNVTSVTDTTRTGALVRKLILSEIALHVVHTAFDTLPVMGTSYQMAEALEFDRVERLLGLDGAMERVTVIRNGSSGDLSWLLNELQLAGVGEMIQSPESVAVGDGSTTIRLLVERWNTGAVLRAIRTICGDAIQRIEAVPAPETSTHHGMGAIGIWNEAKTTTEVLALTKNAFGVKLLRHSGSTKEIIRKVGLVGGAGMEFYGAARRASVDAFITADVRYHEFYRAEHDRILLIDAGHAETERFVAQGIRDVVLQHMSLFELDLNDWADRFKVAETRPNAVRYY